MRSSSQLREPGERSSEAWESSVSVIHKIAVLGELGRYSSIESIRSSNFFDNRIETQIALRIFATSNTHITGMFRQVHPRRAAELARLQMSEMSTSRRANCKDRPDKYRKAWFDETIVIEKGATCTYIAT